MLSLARVFFDQSMQRRGEREIRINPDSGKKSRLPAYEGEQSRGVSTIKIKPRERLIFEGARAIERINQGKSELKL